jgi:dienelactone hydrolase
MPAPDIHLITKRNRPMHHILCRLILSASLLALAGCAALGPGKRSDAGWSTPARTVHDPEHDRRYRLENVFIPAGRDVIAGTLLVPAVDLPPPLVLAVSGAGEGLLVPESPVFRELLARGYAVLALGKKGVGASSGNWRRESFHDRAANVVAALDWAAARGDIDAGRTVLYGHSQGGYVIPLMAGDPRVQALVLAAGPSRDVRGQIRDHSLTTAIFMGEDGAAAERKAARTTRLLDIATRACPVVRFHYLCHVYRYDPAPALAALSKPVLSLFNENDEMVPPSTNMALMRTLLAANPEAEILLLAGADHSHVLNPTGLQANQSALMIPQARYLHARSDDPDHARLAALWTNRLPYAEGFIDAVASFIVRHVPVDPRGGARAPVAAQASAAR